MSSHTDFRASAKFWYKFFFVFLFWMKQSLFNSEVWNMIFAAEYLGDNLADVIEIITCGLYMTNMPHHL